MQLWEYCEVAWTPKQIVIHVYSGRDIANYEGLQHPETWGALLAQLGADGWELVAVLPTRPTNHSLYYFKRPFDSSLYTEWEGRHEKLRKQAQETRAQVIEHRQKKEPTQPLQEEVKPE